MSAVMTPEKTDITTRRRWGLEWVWAGVAVASFHLAYAAPVLGLFMVAYLYGLIRLTEVRTARRAYYLGMLVGMLTFGPQLWFFVGIFHWAAVGLWAILSFWIGLFVLTAWGLRQVGGIRRWAWMLAVPVMWTGLEYFRSELYYLKFSWLTPGMAMAGEMPGGSELVRWVGMYGAGFVMMLLAAGAYVFRTSRLVMPVVVIGALVAIILPSLGKARMAGLHGQQVVGIQLENASHARVVEALNRAVAKYPDAALFVMSEYTIQEPPTERICQWCREHGKYLIIGGMQPLAAQGDAPYRDTAFVVDPKGVVVFSQAKSVPIQFFADGLPAQEQRVWDSPWGKIGICICYDLSYTRVTDELVRQGAQLLIVPSMDVEKWGTQEHLLHARIAPLRAKEYGVPIVRVASSGISQVEDGWGNERARGAFPGHGEMVAAGILGEPSHPHVPVDRIWAMACVVVAGAILAGLLGRVISGKWRAWKLRRG